MNFAAQFRLQKAFLSEEYNGASVRCLIETPFLSKKSLQSYVREGVANFHGEMLRLTLSHMDQRVSLKLLARREDEQGEESTVDVGTLDPLQPGVELRIQSSRKKYFLDYDLIVREPDTSSNQSNSCEEDEVVVSSPISSRREAQDISLIEMNRALADKNPLYRSKTQDFSGLSFMASKTDSEHNTAEKTASKSAKVVALAMLVGILATFFMLF